MLSEQLSLINRSFRPLDREFKPHFHLMTCNDAEIGRGFVFLVTTFSILANKSLFILTKRAIS